jgi:EAL domain-containing protein (putative c-di-GMP-specific phosphodiesterase class I)
VENEEIVEVLDELKIDYYQGFHIGKPSQTFTL